MTTTGSGPGTVRGVPTGGSGEEFTVLDPATGRALTRYRMPMVASTVPATAADMSTYSQHEYTQVEHVALDRTGQARKVWHRTVVGAGER